MLRVLVPLGISGTATTAIRSVKDERHLRRVIGRHRHWGRRAPEGARIVGECTELVCRRRILIEDDHSSGNQQPIEGGQSEKRRGIQVAVIVNDEAGSGCEPVQKVWQGGLKPTLDEADPLIVNLWYRTPQIIGTSGIFLAEVLWQALKGIKANETALRIAVHLRPESDAVSPIDAEFEEVDCGPAAYLTVNMTIKIVQVFECGYPSTLLRDPASNQSIAVDYVEQANVPWK